MQLQEIIGNYELKNQKLPSHVAMIMDGNGRWAKARHMPRSFGHKQGVERVRDHVKMSSELGIKALTLYAFSTENWKRPKEEVGFLMGLLMEYLKAEVQELHTNNVRFMMLGDRSGLSSALVDLVVQAEETTKDNTGLILAVAINYGGQDEIYEAAVRFSQAIKKPGLAPSKALFESQLDSGALPDVDFLIRTSGEHRISNFLLYKGAYAELYFTPVYWPDFSQEEYAKALCEYAVRDRRYGGE